MLHEEWMKIVCVQCKRCICGMEGAARAQKQYPHTNATKGSESRFHSSLCLARPPSFLTLEQFSQESERVDKQRGIFLWDFCTRLLDCNLPSCSRLLVLSRRAETTSCRKTSRCSIYFCEPAFAVQNVTLYIEYKYIKIQICIWNVDCLIWLFF